MNSQNVEEKRVSRCLLQYMTCNRIFVSIFGYHGDDGDDIIYINWLNMARAGLMGLEYFTPEANKWRQVCSNNNDSGY